eukprot:maker-scaffold990_size72856-snap-gene-0.14 protein:Tk06270 transcript:maker-scaffold990_size72856-snap-gene-0.14-mRNA-1 annotation:"af334780_1pregnancy-induced growth inhibitor okl38"
MPCPAESSKSTSSICHASDKVKVYDVLVIGNGPSAITLSYFLSGNVPVYDGTVEDLLLHTRLSQEPEVPLVLQNIEDLAMGCEGRSNNPVSVFFDCLNHPGADMGEERPSLLRWESRPDLKVDHLIIGKGRPGGCWQSMEGDVQTVSLGSWMELPNLKMSDMHLDNFSPKQRAKVSSVAKYYQEYVNQMDLADNFLHHATVTTVSEVTECEFPAKIRRGTKSTSNLPERAKLHEYEHNAVFQQEHIYETDCLDRRGGGFESLMPGPASEADFGSFHSRRRRNSSCSCGCDSGCSCGTSGSSLSSASAQETLAPLPNIERHAAMSRNSLSTTPHGLQIQNSYRQFCIEQNNQMDRKFSDCHLEEYSARDGDIEDLICAWDPIVNPELFCPRGSFPSGSSLGESDCNMSRRRSVSICSMQSQYRGGKCSISDCFPNTNRLFSVQGHINDPRTGTTEDFGFLAKNLVVATGMFDRSNELGVPGEDQPFVFHSLKQLESKISTGELTPNSDPILVVGAGLSAADAILMARGEGLPVLHAFRRDIADPNFVFKKLPKALYPEYHDVFRMMTQGSRDLGPHMYLPLPAHHIKAIKEDRTVTLVTGKDEVVTSFRVSFIVILTGSLPDLGFLEGKLSKNLGILKNEPISRNNPVDIDIFTNEVVDEPGIYAMGPLVGDNFVRFLQGGSLAIASHILQKKCA